MTTNHNTNKNLVNSNKRKKVFTEECPFRVGEDVLHKETECVVEVTKVDGSSIDVKSDAGWSLKNSDYRKFSAIKLEKEEK